ncbi:MAG: signal peptidase II [Nitriliruptorales bacterium]|nr:signal peptidase II [Nitriliruptorales bacterium]
MSHAAGSSDTAAPHPQTPTPRSHPGWLIPITTLGVGLIWLLLDQATKVLVVHALEAEGRVVDLAFIKLNVIRNSGGAFGFPGVPGLFVVVTAVVLFLVIRALPRTDRLSLAVSYGLVCGGAVGNVMDRLFRAPGFPSGAVVDFFDLTWWPIFNIADMGIVAGAMSIALLMTVMEREEREAERARSTADSVRPDTGTPGR